ncbi:MAG: hypothetical protein WC570_03360 [Patescibacteria group bacterium]
MENKNCKQCGVNYEVTDEDLAFYQKVAPEFGGKKYLIPAPNDCPECRMRHCLAMRNVRQLYRRKCDKTGVDIISSYAPNSPYKVYQVDEYEKDDWDPMHFGREFNFSRGFFEQLRELQLAVPKPHAAVLTSTMENADFVNGAHNVKNAYLSFGVEGENLYYCDSTYSATNVCDCLNLTNSQWCYQCVEGTNLYRAFFCQDCHDCRDIYFARNLRGCQNCFGCVELNNKQYCVFNEQKTKSEFEELMTKYKFTQESIVQMLAKMNQLYASIPHKYASLVNVEDCVGDYIANSKNCHNCYEIVGGENLHNCSCLVTDAKDCYDVTKYGFNVELSYFGNSLGQNVYRVLFSKYCYQNARDLIYCDNCYNSVANLFGCVGLRQKQYCILNKQYSKEEYERLVAKIIEHMQARGEWGEFLPYELSDYCYNETMAQDYYPLTKDEAVKLGAKWQDEDFGLKYEGPFYQPKSIDNYDPNQNSNAQLELDELLKGVIKCEVSGKPFRVISQEVAFYIEHGLPIPSKHPEVRYKERFSQRRSRKLFTRQCDRCGVELQSTFDPGGKEKVYCEGCYRKEVI